MTLLRLTIRTISRDGRAVRPGLPFALVATVVLTLALFAGRAAAGVSDYPSPLYLAGGPSTVVGTSFQLVGAAPPAVPATPTVLLVAAGSLSGSYTYIVVAGGTSGPDTASLSVSAAPSAQNVTVGNLPAGTAVDIFRQKSGCVTAVVPGCPFYWVGNSAGATTYTDSLSDALAAANRTLPEASNRIATTFSAICGATTCGYLDLSPGIEPAPGASANTTPPTLAAAPSATPNNRGWIVEGAGGVTIPAGSWTFQVRTKNSNPNGVAHLVVGVWKVTTSGGTIAGSTAILAPTCTGVGAPVAACPANAEGATNLVTAANSVQTVASAVSLPAISLAAGEHLYVQFWRRQTTSYSSGGGGNRLTTMSAYDSLAQISHPAASTPPNDPTLQTPAAAARTNALTLTATFSDPDAGDTGTLNFQVCSDSACSSVVASGSSTSGIANGSNGSASFPLVPDGNYYWRAQATDAATGVSSWTATRAFTLDRVLPNVPTLQSPANGVLLNALPALAALFSDPDASDTGAVSFQVCGDSACSSVVVSGSSPSGLANGSSGSWTPSVLADGTYFWQAKATDAAGNQSSWTGTRSFTLDRSPPDTTIDSRPTDPTNSTGATFAFAATEGGSTFQCSFDGAAFAACASPVTYGALADGSHTFRVAATDATGNTDATPATATWTVDTTPPETAISDGPPNRSNLSATAFGFAATEAGSTFHCSFDGAAFAACTSPVVYTGLADGAHRFQVKATDVAGNTDPTPADYRWTVDTVPPWVPALSAPGDAGWTSALPTLSAVFGDSDAGDGGTISFRVCADAACASILTSGSSSGVANGATADWTIDTPLADGAYYWQARAEDAGGNTSAWSAARIFSIDTVAPGAPEDFVGVVTKGLVKLRWSAPAGGPVRSYTLYIDGVPSLVLGSAAGEVNLGKFTLDDARTFDLAAIDQAGNEGPHTDTLVNVPNVIGLRILEAAAALTARGLEVGDQSKADAAAERVIVVGQTPAAPTLAVTGSPVALVVANPAAPGVGAPLRITAKLIGLTRDRNGSCMPNRRLNMKLNLSATAAVTVRFLTTDGDPVASRQLGPVRAGATRLHLDLPASVSGPKVYRVVVTATTKKQVASVENRLTLAKPPGQSHDGAAFCSKR